jgi:hypothetical protein
MQLSKLIAKMASVISIGERLGILRLSRFKGLHLTVRPDRD